MSLNLLFLKIIHVLKSLVLWEVADIEKFNNFSEIFKRQDKFLTDIFHKSSVSILGCGGIGSNASIMLARAGVSTINIFDFDKVEFSNLNRQNYTYEDVGRSKVLITKKKIEETIPNVKVNAMEIFVDKNNLDEIVKSSNIFIEAFDKREKKMEAFDYFLDRDEFLIMASGLSGLGNLEDIRIKRIKNITMIGDFKSTTDDGLFAPYVSVIASLQALEALKIMGGYYE